MFVTRCAYAQGRVKRLSPSICLLPGAPMRRGGLSV